MKEELTNQVRFLLLSVIDNDADIDDIHKLGYSYSQITNMIKTEIETGNAQFQDKILSLTEKGAAEKKALAKELKFSIEEQIILPKFSAKLEDKIEINEIFIPSQNELDF